MFRTPKVGTRALASIATIATLTGVTLPLLATAANAAVSSVAIDSSSDSQKPAGGSATLHVNVSGTAFPDTTLIKYAIVSGPDADQLHNGALVADGPCAITPGTSTAETAACSIANGGTAGTDVIRVFADTNGNLVADAGEPSADASVIFFGAPAALSISPTSDTAAAGTCNAYTVTLTDSGGRAVPDEEVNLEANLTGTTTSRDLKFCDPGTTNPTSSDAGADSITGSATATGLTDFTDSNGKATFGIESNEPGGAHVLAFFDTDSSGTFNAGEPSANATKTFTAGGPLGNAAQDAVASLTVSPTSQNAVAGDTGIAYVLTAKNASGDTTPNVVISYAITGANPTTNVLAATDNSGKATLTYNTPTAGTDTITFWVNQTTGATAGADSNEPKATATTTIAAAPTGQSLALTCVGTAANATTKDCVDPTTDNNEVFTATVTHLVGSVVTPTAGILVRFTKANVTAPGTPAVSPTSAVTDANGVATTTLTDVAEVNLSKDSVTATIAGTATALTGTVTWKTAVPTTVTVAPALNTTQTGTQSAFVATVSDQFARPVAGVNTDFTIAGRNASLNGPALLDKVTDANGQAPLTYTDVGPSNDVSGANASDTITATADYVTENDIQNGAEPQGTAVNNFITEPATAGTVDLDVTGAGTCGVTTVDPANDAKSYDPAALTTTHPVCALVKTAGGAKLTGKTVSFALTGVGTFVKSDGTALTSPQTATTDSNGVAHILVASTKSGAQNLTATIDGKSDAATVTYNAAVISSARNIALKPANGAIAPGASKELTALVTDKFGNPVAGITVDFTETGAGSFGNGVSSASGVTGSTGTVSVTLTSPAGSTGSEAVTASINNGAASTDCDVAADSPTTGDPAGNCTDTRTYTYQSSAAPTISVSPTALNVGQYATVVVHGTPGDAVQILAYSRPATTYKVVRNGTIGANGIATFSVGPRTNTRLYAKTAGGSSTSAVISVRPAESLFGTASGKVGSFHGGIVPGHAGVTVRLFTVKNGVRSSSPVGTATTGADGKWTFSRTFAATGSVTFISQTLSDLTNLAGQSNRVTITFK